MNGDKRQRYHAVQEIEIMSFVIEADHEGG